MSGKTISNRGRYGTVAGVLLCLALAGCLGSATKPLDCEGSKGGAPPGWAVTGQAPSSDGRLCQVGFCGPTYYKKDSVERAIENARGHLAKALRVRVESIMLDIERERGGYSSSRTIEEVSTYTTEAVIEGSKVEGTWYDEDGLGFARQERATYALVCMDDEKAVRKFREDR